MSEIARRCICGALVIRAYNERTAKEYDFDAKPDRGGSFQLYTERFLDGRLVEPVICRVGESSSDGDAPGWDIHRCPNHDHQGEGRSDRCDHCAAPLLWAFADRLTYGVAYGDARLGDPERMRQQLVPGGTWVALDREPTSGGILEAFFLAYPDGEPTSSLRPLVRLRPADRPASSPGWFPHHMTCPARRGVAAAPDPRGPRR